MLTYDELQKLTMDVFFKSPGAIMAGLTGALEAGDEETARNICRACQERGIDLPKLIFDDIERHERLWSRKVKVLGGGKARIPMTYQ